MRVNGFPRFAGDVRKWASDVTDRLDDLLNFLKSDIIPNARLITRNGRSKKIARVTAESYAATLQDEIISVNFAGAVTIALLEAPHDGYCLFVYDASGAANTNNITIAPDGSTQINGGDSVLINAGSGAYKIIYDAVAAKYFAFDI